MKNEKQILIWSSKITLGPAGPPLQRGVLVVPQSAQVFFWLSSDDELPFEFFPVMLSSNGSDRCIRNQKQKRSDQWFKIKRKREHHRDWDFSYGFDHSLCHSDPTFCIGYFEDLSWTQLRGGPKLNWVSAIWSKGKSRETGEEKERGERKRSRSKQSNQGSCEWDWNRSIWFLAREKHLVGKKEIGLKR